MESKNSSGDDQERSQGIEEYNNRSNGDNGSEVDDDNDYDDDDDGQDDEASPQAHRASTYNRIAYCFV